MLVEGDDERHRVMLARVGQRLADDLLVAEMHAVKDTDGQADFVAARIQVVGGVDEFHRKKSSNIQAPSTREIPSFKFQTMSQLPQDALKLGAWCFSGCWSLEFGASISRRRQFQKRQHALF